MIPTKNHFSKYRTFLARHPLFEGVSGEELSTFTQSMQIQQYHKGEMVTFDDCSHANLYIAYEGLLKLTKIDEKGDEIVLSILDKNSAVTPMYFSPHYDVCAEFVKNTTLFHFSGSDIRRFIDKNHAFSNNIIQFLADSVQTLMISAEVLQLKSAKEKVGWYLVHAKINNTFEMPYSKTLTASYLGMKPESFSRALSDLKKEGVILENKKIKLKNGDELCKYCDRVAGSTCAFFRTDSCIHD
ncbi:MAG: Crp/Fnr family transcriptional regulator [Candidatus Ruthia sp.]|nr:Crp/Fnr family transcriptional regulator [Candidatus Ruthturnera sp.]MBT4122335.1 Crp/Fnr family transcriptional regulator [Candidatus Ruthturnera sp.]MBT6922899.1 Crp/Fnr family transcriptional regulator [Candidatus Ruthturnera sp.]